MAHRGKDEGDLFLVMAYIGCLVMKLCHQHTVVFRVPGGEAGQGGRELVAENENEVTGAAHFRSGASGANVMPESGFVDKGMGNYIRFRQAFVSGLL